MKKLLFTLSLLAFIYLLLMILPTPATVPPTKNKEKNTDILSTNSYQQSRVSLVAYTETETQQKEKSDSQWEKGSFISVSADYRRYLGFPGYVRLMKKHGGHFFLFDAVHHKLIAEVNPLSGKFSTIDKNKLNQFSPRAREIQQEIALNKVLRAATKRYGNRKYKIMLLLTQKFDDQIQKSLYHALKNHGVDSSAITQVNGVYNQDVLKVYSINHSKKGELPMQFDVYF